ncbi:site-specific DNA-methyltransferase [Candidatus Poribacteria bacterium]|nr:site-specific DNA-methyltransferase [Candidatus Poribacteria bacterium]
MTELIWQGKYDKEGRKTAPVRIVLPFQTIETVNESALDRQRTLDLFSQGKQTDWRNRLIWGDKKYVLPSLLPEFAGKVNLIYIDPPFFTGTDQLLTVSVPDSEEIILKEPSIIEEAAYRNVWSQGSSSFCAWMYETLCDLHELLADDGAIFIRFDQYWSHYVKVIADEVFGKKNFQNDIAVKRIYKNFTNQGRRSIQIATDSLLLYFKSEQAHFYDISQKLTKQRPGYWRIIDDSSGVRNPPQRVIFGKIYHPPPGKHFKFGQGKIDQMAKEGKIRINDKGRPEYWVEATDTKPLTSNWTDISGYSFTTGYPTENSEELLDRSIRVCSKVGDLVLDCFCGSGTTAAVAEKLGRRWIACDLGRFAIHTTRKRLLRIEGVRPFVVQNLGKYERQAWMTAAFESPEDTAAHQRAYRNFILELYHATPINGYRWLHGVRAGRMVHVGSVDAPIAIGDVKGVVTEFWKSVGKGGAAPHVAQTDSLCYTNGVDILGWEFAFELNEVAVQIAAEANLNLAFKKIPREVLEKRAVEQGDIRFFELAALSVDVNVNNRGVTLKLTDFVIPPDDVPADVQRAVTHWSQWIDYWAVDWDFKGDTFHNQWQSYRTKKDTDLQKQITHTYDQAGVYRVMVKVIDILGNDTTKVMEVKIT